MKQQQLPWWVIKLHACILGLILLAATSFSVAADPAVTSKPRQAATAKDKLAPAIETNQVAILRYFVNGIIENTQWPPASTPELTLCVAGSPALQHNLQDAPITKHDGVLRLQTIAEDTPPSRLYECSVLLIGQDIAESTASRWVLSLIGRPILTIRENPEQCRNGALVCLYTAKSLRPTFDINLDSVSRSGVLISPLVLTLSNTLPSELLPQTTMQ